MPVTTMCCEAMIPECTDCQKANAAKMKAWQAKCHIALAGEACRNDAVGPHCFDGFDCVVNGGPISEHTPGTCQVKDANVSCASDNDCDLGKKCCTSGGASIHHFCKDTGGGDCPTDITP
jgi:hypothetical protein